MDSKLKSLKVVDLKAILSKVNVAFPARATKADLISKVLASQAAIDVFLNPNGAPTQPPPAIQSPLPPQPQSQPEPELELLEDPSPEPAVSETPAPPSPQSLSSAQLPPPKAPSVPPTTVPSTDTPDPELEKRKARAERFGIPLVQPTPPKTKQPRPPKPAALSNSAPPEDSAKLKSRAARFGIAPPTQTNGSPDTKSKKRAAAEPVDDAELEKRRKRAERFGLPVAT